MELMSKVHRDPSGHLNICTGKVTSSLPSRGESGRSGGGAEVPATVDIHANSLMFTVKLCLQGSEPPTEATG